MNTLAFRWIREGIHRIGPSLFIRRMPTKSFDALDLHGVYSEGSSVVFDLQLQVLPASSTISGFGASGVGALQVLLAINTYRAPLRAVGAIELELARNTEIEGMYCCCYLFL